MAKIKCEYCGKEKTTYKCLKYYAYKRRISCSVKICYFCCYECMKKSEEENPNKYGVRREKF